MDKNMNKRLIIFIQALFCSKIGASNPFVNSRSVSTLQFNLCIVPIPGVQISCDAPLTQQGDIATTDLRCFDNPNPAKRYCIKCVEIVGKKPKTCQILDVKGDPIH